MSTIPTTAAHETAADRRFLLLLYPYVNAILIEAHPNIWGIVPA